MLVQGLAQDKCSTSIQSVQEIGSMTSTLKISKQRIGEVWPLVQGHRDAQVLTQPHHLLAVGPWAYRLTFPNVRFRINRMGTTPTSESFPDE